MYDFALNAHSGMRYLVLLLGVLTAAVALVGFMRKRPVDNAGLLLLRLFTAAIDIQVLLGIVTLITGRFFGALMGHIFMMIAAAAVAHLGSVRLKKAEPTARGYGMLLATALIPLALMIAGILAIQRPIL
jgi:heme A synthase